MIASVGARRSVAAGIVAGAIFALAAAWTMAQAESGDPPKPDPQPPAARSGDATKSLEAFADVYAVLISPRCANCHPQDGVPRQGDSSRPHAQNITRASAASGLPCEACHRHQNAPFRGGPPGVHDWHMPPADTPMAFLGKSPAELCAQLSDPQQTGGREVEDLIAHAATDHLVLWAWEPGPGRSPPPISHAAFVDAVRTWVREGAHCPIADADPRNSR
jgi:hypothetical protein